MAYPPAYGGYPGAGYPTYFYVRSRQNGLVMDVEGGNRNPGARVIMWNQKMGGDCDNQLWYEDQASGTFRSKMNGFCLDLAGDTVVLQPHCYGNINQQWMRADPFIQNRTAPHRVLDIADGNNSPGARLIAWNRHGGVNQTFDFIPFTGGSYPSVPAHPAYPSYPAYPACPPSRQFFIVSEMHGQVLDVEGGNRSAGANLIVWHRHSPPVPNQLWHTDHEGIVRSALNDFALEAGAAGQHVRLMPYNGSCQQRWIVSGNRVVKHTNPNECLDIEGGNMGEGTKVILWNYKGSSNQHWRVEYV